MSLDSRLHVIYGYKLDKTPIENFMENEENFEDLYEDALKDKELIFIEDHMCGNYEYLGLPIFSESSDYGEENFFEIMPNDIIKACDDEKLDTLIQEKMPYLVGKFYDIAGLMNGELPKIHIVKTVS